MLDLAPGGTVFENNGGPNLLAPVTHWEAVTSGQRHALAQTDYAADHSKLAKVTAAAVAVPASKTMTLRFMFKLASYAATN